MRIKVLTVVSIIIFSGYLQGSEGSELSAKTDPKRMQCNAPPSCPPEAPKVLMEGYNANAAVQTHGNWDYFTTMSFIYWKATQDNMEVAILDPVDTSTIFETTSSPLYGQISKGKIINTDADYHSGFKINTGFKSNFDDWDVTATYTWYRSTNTTDVSIASPSPSAPGMIFPMLGHTATQGDQYYNSASSTWRLKMDLADFTVGRLYHVGKKLTFHTYSGLRAAWIAQKRNTTYINAVYTAEAIGTTFNHVNSHSWALGPKIGVDLNWNLTRGFSIYNKNSADLLYTKYTQLRSFDGPRLGAFGAESTYQLDLIQDGLDGVRPHFEFELGAGWGSYFNCRKSSNCKKFWADLMVGYSFQVFMDQNMFATYMNDESDMIGKKMLPSGNLYIQGLTITASVHY